jgi:hypothetical protein
VRLKSLREKPTLWKLFKNAQLLGTAHVAKRAERIRSPLSLGSCDYDSSDCGQRRHAEWFPEFEPQGFFVERPLGATGSKRILNAKSRRHRIAERSHQSVVLGIIWRKYLLAIWLSPCIYVALHSNREF